MFEEGSSPQDNFVNLEWLVDNRSDNQKSTLRLYKLMMENKEKISKDQWRKSTAQKLLGIAFSLWRAVFLADLKRKRGSMIKDVEEFALELIQTNNITYGFDRQKNDWTFRYYLQNATDRLNKINRDFNKKGRNFNLPGSARGKTPQERWVEHQKSLDEAITAFESIISGRATGSRTKRSKLLRAKREKTAES